MRIFGLHIVTARRYQADLAAAEGLGEAVGKAKGQWTAMVDELGEAYEVGRAAGQAERNVSTRRWPANRRTHLRLVR